MVTEDYIGSDTLLSLEEFRTIMDISPWTFNQMDVSKLGYQGNLKEWYQSEAVTASTISRNAITDAIQGAEEALARELKYWPAPKAIVGEKIKYPSEFDASWLNGWYNERGMLKSVHTQFAYIHKIGLEDITDLEVEAAVAFFDSDGDGINDAFTTAAIPTTVTDPAEIFVTFSDADRVSLIGGGERKWQIRPVKVVISAGFVTVTGPIWLLVRPTFKYRAVPLPLDPTDTAATFVQRVKVSRLYVDETLPGSLVYEHVPCDGSTADPCDQVELAVCYSPRDKTKKGIVIPTLASGTCIPNYLNGRAPDVAKINYVAGYPRKAGGFATMDSMHALMVARLATTLLPERAGSSNSETQIDHWRAFPTGSDKNTLFASPMMNSNPFGLTNGAIWTWLRVLEMNDRAVAGAIR